MLYGRFWPAGGSTAPGGYMNMGTGLVSAMVGWVMVGRMVGMVGEGVWC